MKKLTTEKFIQNAKAVHGDKYDYTESVYINSTTPLIIKCNGCGDSFEKKPNKHISSKQGCPKCISKRVTTEKFIQNAVDIHGDKYDYDLIGYIKDNKQKLKIKCKKCDEFFEKSYLNHINNKQGCPKCSYREMSKKNTLDQKTVINRYNTIHNNIYDYSKTIYKSAHDKIIVTCKTHGDFEIYPYNHDRGDGCPQCFEDDRVCNLESFVEKSKSKFSYFDYKDFKYFGVFDKSFLICKKHNYRFQITPNNHLHSKFGGCKICETENKSISLDVYIERCNQTHGNEYDYSLIAMDYTGINRKKINIKCPTHGVFKQSAIDHYNGCGCQKCAPSKSKYEDMIQKHLEDNNIKFIKNDRTLINPMELDFVLTDYKIAIEINGLRYHTEISGDKNRNYHKNKTGLCEALGYKLIHINEDEILHKQNIVISKIDSMLSINKRKLFARKCEVKDINKDIANKFLDKYHLQGKTQNTYINIGLFYNNKLVSVMSFGGSRNKSKKNTIESGCYELTRYCNNFNFYVVGGASKLLAYFNKTYKPKKIISFADKRWSNGDLYYKLGFKLDEELDPDYRYTTGRYPFVTLHKSGFKHANIKKKLLNYDENVSEWENMVAHGWDRIWDCGKMKFEKTIDKNPKSVYYD